MLTCTQTKKRKKDKKKKKKKKRKRKRESDSSEEEVQRSVISGKRIKLKLDKTREDREEDMRRAKMRQLYNLISWEIVECKSINIANLSILCLFWCNIMALRN